MTAAVPPPARRWSPRSQAPWSGCVRARTGAVAFVDVGDCLIALHGPEVEPFPFSVVLAGGPVHPGLRGGVRVSSKGDAVWLGGRWHAVLPPDGRTRPEPAAEPGALRRAIGATPAVRRRRHEVAGVLDVALGALRAGSPEETVRLLVGWGPGLTPSGDDVLVGLAAGAALRPGAWDAGALVAAAAAAARRRSTFVSHAVLEAAAAGSFAPALSALGVAGDARARDAAIRRVARIGSRSGVDLLVGVEAGLRLTAPSRVGALRLTTTIPCRV